MDDVLLPGERILETQSANLLLGLDLHDPVPPAGRWGAFVSTAQALGRAIQGRAIGGTLHLTNYRFYFASHGANWTRGAYSVFLPCVVADDEVDGLLSDQLTIVSKAAQHRFVVSNAQAFANTLDDAQPGAPSREVLGKYVLAELDKVGTDLSKQWSGTHPSSEMLALMAQSVEAKEGDAIQALAVLTALELFLDA